MAGPGGARPNSGRKRGGKNKATIERELNLARAIDEARRTGRELAVDVLERAMKLAEGAAGKHRPAVGADGATEGGDWGSFGDWFDRWTWCAKELANYQSPKLGAVLIASAVVSKVEVSGGMPDDFKAPPSQDGKVTTLAPGTIITADDDEPAAPAAVAGPAAA